MTPSTPAPNGFDGKFRAVVFDWAGTMVDFGSFAPMGAFVRAFASFGVEVDIADARKPMGARKWDHIAAMLAEPHIAARWQAAQGSAPDAAAVDRVYQVFVPMNEAVAADYATLVPGALETVQWLRARGLKIGSTTGYTRSIMERVLPVAAAQGYVPDNLVCADDLPEGRPGPLMMMKCFVDLAVYPPQAVLKVDDTEPGIAEGVAAGCMTVGLALSGNEAGLSVEELAALSEAERDTIRARATALLRAAGADHVIDTVADLPALIGRLEAEREAAALAALPGLAANEMPQGAPLPAPRLGEPYLLTPGPLTTSFAVKAAMLRDWGSWDDDFRAMTRRLRAGLIALLGAGREDYDCVPMQGSGSYLVEAMLGSFVPASGKVLVLANGAYGLRAAQTLRTMGRACRLIDKGDYLPPRGTEVAQALAEDAAITHVLAIHCETSSGILNPLAEIAEATRQAGRKLLIDSMSAFGAVPLEPAEIAFEAMVSSANKCIEGVPGFGFVLARRAALAAAAGNSPSLALDVAAQWAAMEKTGQWRFTPPTHAVAAFLAALAAHEAEGGVAGRGARYRQNRDQMVAGMRALGFETLLPDAWLSPIIVTFFAPADPAFDFSRFYAAMKARGFIIYPGKLTEVESFRIGCIGQMDAAVMGRVVQAAAAALAEMGVTSAAPAPEVLAERLPG